MSALLKRFPLLADLTDSELEVFARHLRLVAVGRGEYLFREGDPGDSFYLLAIVIR